MIQWIALAVALDAEGRASRAQDGANEANTKLFGVSPMVIIQPFNLIYRPYDESKGFFSNLFNDDKILDSEPWGKLSVRRSDILNMRQYRDSDGKKYVAIEISKYAHIQAGNGAVTINVNVPGTLEEIAGILG